MGYRIHALTFFFDGRWGFFTAAAHQFLDTSEIGELCVKYPIPDMYQN